MTFRGQRHACLVREPDAGDLHVRFDERDVETELWSEYSGTARRKGRQQTSPAYCHRATSRLYRQPQSPHPTRAATISLERTHGRSVSGGRLSIALMCRAGKTGASSHWRRDDAIPPAARSAESRRHNRSNAPRPKRKPQHRSGTRS
jgi:hypothetical protein